MSLYKPTLISEALFEVEVNSELNKEYLTSNGESLLTFLRGKVKNDNLTMTIKIAKENVIKKALTSREIFEEMVEKNSNLQNLSDEFGLELS
jgi:DNA polymerase-3 subunit gamma/tau